MRIVLDTNVLVSALLKPGSVPATILSRILRGEATILYDRRILTEYVEVLHRPNFSFNRDDVLRVLSRLAITGQRVDAQSVNAILPDPDDAPFFEVAITGNADAIVTGNARDFPQPSAIPILSPREFILRLGKEKIVIHAISYNVEQRYDGDWVRVDDPWQRPGTVPEWERYCEENDLELVVKKIVREPRDPLREAQETIRRFYNEAGIPLKPELRSISDPSRLVDELELTIQSAHPIPRRFSGLNGLLRMLHTIAQGRGIPDKVLERSISLAVARVVKGGSDRIEQWDVCGVCGTEFRYPNFQQV